MRWMDWGPAALVLAAACGPGAVATSEGSTGEPGTTSGPAGSTGDTAPSSSDAVDASDDTSGSSTSPGTTTATDTGEPVDVPPEVDPFPDVARVAVPATWTAQPDGTYALDTGEELFDVGPAFYRDHDDVYDMLIVWTEFDVRDIFAFSVPLDHAIDGIGLQEVMALYGWDDLTPAAAGSDGVLQHIALMNSPATYENLGFYSAQDIITHEIGHRWSAYIALPDPTATWALTDAFHSHWNIYANMGGPSALGYGQLVDQGSGAFEYELVVPLQYSDIELYQQGLIPPEEVGETFYVTDAADFQPPTNGGTPWTETSYGGAVTFTATRVEFDIDDVIASHGPRVPAHADAQTAFRMAFVLVCEDVDACDADALAWVDEQRQQWEPTFATATGDRATVDTSLD